MLKKIALVVHKLNEIYQSIQVLSLDCQLDRLFEYALELQTFKTLIDACNFSEQEIKEEITKRCPDLEPDLQIMLWQYIDYH